MSNVGGSAARAVFNVGGVEMIDLSSLKVLTALVNATKYSTFITGAVGATAYQVPTGKSLRVLAMQTFQAGAVTTFNIGYGDTDNGFNNAAAPTNNVQATQSVQVLAGVNAALPFHIIIPALKYPYVQAGAVNISGIVLYGYEF